MQGAELFCLKPTSVHPTNELIQRSPLKELAMENAPAAPVRVATATTSAADLAEVRKELLPWLQASNPHVYQ